MIDSKIEKKNVEDMMGLTAMQEGMLFHYLSNPGSQQYFEQFRFRLKGRPDVERFKQAWQTVGQSNEMLRAAIRWEKLEEPVQVVLKDREIPVRIRHYNGVRAESRTKLLDKIIADDRREGIDLAEAPLRVTLCLADEVDGNDESDMLITFHHILYDGWSNGIVLSEFLAAYNSLADGRGPQKVHKTKYKEFIRWYRSQDNEKQETFWKEYLEGFDTRTQLPYDSGKASAIESVRTCSAGLSSVFKQRLDDCGKQHHVTAANLIYTAWGLLLQKYNGSDDVIFGAAVSGRQPVVKGIESMVGLFINTLPMRLRAGKNDVLAEVLNDVGRHLEERKEYEHSSLARVKRLGLVGIDLFDSLVVIDNYPLDSRLVRQETETEAGPVSAGNRLAIVDYSIFEMNSFDVTLQVMLPDAGQMKMDFHYNAEVFEDATVERLAGHYLNILEEISTDPYRKISQIEMLSAAEMKQVLEEFNRSDVEQARNIERTIHEVIMDQVLRSPDNWAVEYEGQRLTYRQLNEKADRLAWGLASHGVCEGSRVVLMTPRSLDMAAALLGIFKAGAACIPLDISYPLERSRYIIRDSDAHMLLTTSAGRGCEGIQTLFIEEFLSAAFTGSQDQDFSLPQSPGPGGLAYIVYTSGSTGMPKGMLLPHRGIINHAYTKIAVLEINETDTVAHNFTINFIASIWQILAPLFVGAKMTIYSEAVEKDPYTQFSRAAADGVTVIEVVPSIMKSYLYLLEEGKEVINLDSLKKIALTGEEVKPSLVNRFYSRYTIPLVNCYGQTECSDDVLHYKIPVDVNTLKVPIGYPAFNTRVLILNHHDRLQPVGVVGEICVSGAGVGYGYGNRPEMTSEKFYRSYTSHRTHILYRTGDLGRWMSDGRVEYMGRMDHQVKIRGNRVELREIDNHLLRYPAIKEAAVIVKEDSEGENKLYAFFMSDEEITAGELRQYLLKTLPDYMAPAHFVRLEKLPLTPSGKIDRKALVRVEIKGIIAPGTEYRPPRSEIEKKILVIWQQVLEKESIGINDNFFDLGGHSLLLIKLKSKLEKTFGRDIAIVELFNLPSIGLQARYFEEKNADNEKKVEFSQKTSLPTVDTAVIGISLRVPGARDIVEFWENLKNGVESISFFPGAEVEESKMNRFIRGNCLLVPAGGVLGDIDLFDADFFGYTPREAEVMDPQQRLFLEHAWLALEDAGYVGETYPGAIGVYAGVGFNSYLLNNVLANAGVVNALGEFQAALGNDKDFLATRVSYKLNLKGPALTVQCACSTSLAAVHLARQALRSGDCDMALVGGTAVRVPEKTGYFFTQQGHLSPDGHCRPFDAGAKGTVFGNGVAVVVLKRLPDAVEDGDHIHAVIKGSAINNDGSLKVGYTSPSGVAQAEVVRKAFNDAGVDPATIGYLETHGTGTVMGDPVEIAAVARAFHAWTNKKQYCAIGSVKANIGHLDVAAGVVGLIKTVLCLEHHQIPPSINFQHPNPTIDFENSPFFVNRSFSQWPTPVNETPRRAAVNALGIGGTNAHVILEEYTKGALFEKTAPFTPAKTSNYLILLSARTESALQQTTQNLVEYLKTNPAADTPLGDVCYTLSVGRKAFDCRLALVCRDNTDAADTLETFNPKRLIMHTRTPGDKSIVFMFPGVGEHYVNMASQLYRHYPVFRREIDTCCKILEPLLEKDLREILFKDKKDKQEKTTNETNNIDLKKLLDREETSLSEEEQELSQTIYSQTSVFVVEYALAGLLTDWGIKPYAMIGYSIGEYTAACLAGVFSLQDALFLVASRARLIHSLEKGAMLAVSLSENELKTLLMQTGIQGVSIAAINTPDLCIVSGEAPAVESLEIMLKERKIIFRRLKTFQAFHSHMMETVREELSGVFKKVVLHPPRVPYISNVSGTWIRPEQASAPDYWVTHTVSSIRFSEGIGELLQTPCNFFLEIGPGNSLCGFTAQHHFAKDKDKKKEDRFVLASMPKESERVPGQAFLLRTLGKLWAAGLEIDWPSYYNNESQPGKRIPLPTYPFERKRYWLDAETDNQTQEIETWGDVGNIKIPKKENIADWFYIPSWKLSLPPSLSLEKAEAAAVINPHEEENWLFFLADTDIGFQLIRRLQTGVINRDSHIHITIVKLGKQFEKHAGGNNGQYMIYEIDPGKYDDYTALLQDLREQGKGIAKIIHLWQWGSTGAADFLDRGVYSLLYLVKAMAKQSIFNSIDLWMVSRGLHKIESADACNPEKAAILGPCKVISQEYPHIKCRSIDFAESTADSHHESRVVQTLLAEIWASPPGPIIAYRGGNRWVRSYEPVKLDTGPDVPVILREKGVYLVVGGLGNVGSSIAQYLAMAVHARLVLTSRSELPVNAADHPGRLKIKQLEEMGAEVSVVQVDAGDKNQLRQAVNHAEEKYGALHGVLYAAGNMSESAFKLIADSDRQDCELHFSPKIRGLMALEEALREKELDFCILTSSLSPILGGLSLYAYSAANSFMDGFAYKQSMEQGKNWLSINWADWENNGGKPIDDRCANPVLGSTVVQLNITPEEGKETFKRVLSMASGGNRIPGIIVSSGNLQRRLQQWVSAEEAVASKRQGVHKRPQQLHSIYEAPRDEAEKIVAEIWQELLGIEMIGVHDNFFELGGHSLIATKLVSRLREIFRIDIPLPTLFERPTIRGVVENIAQNWGDPDTVAEIAAAYREVEMME